ncbi:L(+)-tartrate dehydratase subunit alpha [Escherichia coli]|nr:L(+)-tartrate dehydratase subunit alpha [Escherichia coli]
MMSESNKQQAVNKLTEIVANFTAMISTRMPDDVVDKLKQLKDAETSSMGKSSTTRCSITCKKRST